MRTAPVRPLPDEGAHGLLACEHRLQVEPVVVDLLARAERSVPSERVQTSVARAVPGTLVLRPLLVALLAIRRAARALAER